MWLRCCPLWSWTLATPGCPAEPSCAVPHGAKGPCSPVRQASWRVLRREEPRRSPPIPAPSTETPVQSRARWPFHGDSFPGHSV